MINLITERICLCAILEITLIGFSIASPAACYLIWSATFDSGSWLPQFNNGVEIIFRDSSGTGLLMLILTISAFALVRNKQDSQLSTIQKI